MIEYTPTTYEARKWYSWKPLTTVDGTFDKKYEAEFDRWLAEHDQEVAERERNRIIWWLENELDIAQHFGRSWSLGRRQYKKFAYGFKIAIGILKGEIDE